MKKDIWLKPGKQINSGAIVGGVGSMFSIRKHLNV